MNESYEAYFKPVDRNKVKNDYLVIHEFIEYLRNLAEQDVDYQMTAGQVWRMYKLGVEEGMHWTDVADELELPRNFDWS